MDKVNQFVLIEEHGGDGIFCIGVFDDVEKAIGHAMNAIWDFQNSYKDEGDKFEISAPYDLEGDAGFGIDVTFKYSKWDHECTHHWYILDYTKEEV